MQSNEVLLLYIYTCMYICNRKQKPKATTTLVWHKNSNIEGKKKNYKYTHKHAHIYGLMNTINFIDHFTTFSNVSLFKKNYLFSGL